jgi:hypothetical protein
MCRLVGWVCHFPWCTAPEEMPLAHLLAVLVLVLGLVAVLVVAVLDAALVNVDYENPLAWPSVKCSA